ncbi:LysR family transcriptional regulator [Reyranella sp. CPCC 100927]|uniref:LysR family transcriptional regulator n=1 Tax=Reyranella sp. CPCC 100927 TaxID=2599616 RepID=UPI0011B8176E|nr:LysR family transcriptional regulator [Reyranella sp. CPCC 100927]TWT13663.1 LysR family transcriptional regulator [Reyranella sp. CPCC 100927]
MDFRQMQYFVALVEEKSITKAARRLNVVQPAVSIQIRKIETDFGVSLFERRSGGVYPNGIAKRLYPHCLDILERMANVRKLLVEASGRFVGKVSIGIPPSAAHDIVPRVLIDYHKAHPEMQILAHEGYTANLVEWLVRGVLDLAIISFIEGDRRLKLQPLIAEELVLVASGDTKVRGNVVPCANLDKFKLVLPSSQNLTRILMETELERAGLTLSSAMETDSLTTVFALLRNPGWATILPASAVSTPNVRRGLKVMRLVEPVLRRTLVIATLPNKVMSDAENVFIDRLKAAFAEASEQGHAAGRSAAKP